MVIHCSDTSVFWVWFQKSPTQENHYTGISEKNHVYSNIHIIPTRRLFISQGVDGIQFGGFPRRIESEKYSDRTGEEKCQDDGAGQDHGVHLGKLSAR